MKKIILSMVLTAILLQGVVAVNAADYVDKSFSFCCQQASYNTAKYTKGVTGYTYFKYNSGQPAIYVNVIDYNTSNVSNKKYINDHQGYALTNGVIAGNKVYLRLTRQSKDNTYDTGVWSPDCAGSYTVK